MSKKIPDIKGRSLAGLTVNRGQATPNAVPNQPQQSAAVTPPPAVATPQGDGRPAAVLIQEFSFEACVPGAIVRVPLHLIDINPLSPRRNYTEEVVDKIVLTLPSGQFDAAHGYIEGGRVKLIDGGTRFRAARDTDTKFLDVKFEPAPESKLALFNRARDYNENRSDTTPLDFALSLRALLEEGAVASQKDLVTQVKGPNGKDALNEGAVSKYLRIARMPGAIQRMMASHESTATMRALFGVSELFPEDLSDEKLSERTFMAKEIVEEIKLRNLNVKQIESLVKSKLEGPKSRERSTAHPLSFGTYKGVIKTFAKKGRFELQLNGLDESKQKQLQDELEAVVKRVLQA